MPCLNRSHGYPGPVRAPLPVVPCALRGYVAHRSDARALPVAHADATSPSSTQAVPVPHTMSPSRSRRRVASTLSNNVSSV